MKTMMSATRTVTVDSVESTSGAMKAICLTPYLSLLINGNGEKNAMISLKYAEPILKGPATRSQMEALLVSNVRKALQSVGARNVRVEKESGVLLVEAEDEPAAARVLARVFGIERVFLSRSVPVDEAGICAACVEAAAVFQVGSSFAVRAKRACKRGRTSQELAAACGAAVFDAYPEKRLTVDLSEPQTELFVEVRRDRALISGAPISGPGGLPLGCEGRGMCVVTDRNPGLAAWMMAKRGVQPVLLIPGGVSPEIVDETQTSLAAWLPGLMLDVHRTGALWGETVGQKRALLEEACRVASDAGCGCIILGDGFGDVRGTGVLAALDIGLPLPVFRPLVGMGNDAVGELAGRTGFRIL